MPAGGIALRFSTTGMALIEANPAKRVIAWRRENIFWDEGAERFPVTFWIVTGLWDREARDE